MRDVPNIDINSLPIGYAEIRIAKDKIKQNYSYQIEFANFHFKNLLSSDIYSEKEDFVFCAELEAELFSQKRLKSYYNVLINNSFMEFEQYCDILKRSFIMKFKPLSTDLLSFTLVSIPKKIKGLKQVEISTNYAKILDSTFDLMFILDKDLRIKHYNQEAKRIFAIEKDNTQLDETINYVHPEDRKLALEIINNIVKNPNNEKRADIRILKRDHGYLYMHFVAKNMLDEEGINGIVVNAIDVNYQKNNEKKIIENELYLESLFKAIPNMIFVMDYQGTFLDFKSFNTSNLAIQPKDFLGKNISSLLPEYLSKRVVSSLKMLKLNKEVLPISYQFQNQSQKMGYFECTLSNINDEKALAIVNDVTALKEAEEKLTRSQKLIQKKLDAIIAPEGKLSDLELSDLINIEELKDMFQTINDFTNIPVTLIDKNGDILISIGMSRLCKDFHIAKRKSLSKCFESNIHNTNNLKLGESKLYKCLNNIWNLVCPIYVGGEQIASLNICQFRLANDTKNYEESLRQLANTYDFDKEAYIKAYYELPKLDKEHLVKISSYYRDFLSKITALSYAQIKQARTANQLRLREEKLVQITDNMTDVFFIYDLDLNVTYISPSVKKLFGLSPEEYKEQTLEEKFPVSSIEALKKALNKALESPYDEKQNVLMEIQEYNNNGDLIDLSLHAKLLRYENKKPIGIIGSARDISEKKKAEEELNTQLKLQSLLSSIAMHYINIPLDKIKESISDSLKEFALFAKADRAYIFKYDWEKGTVTNTYEWCKEGINPEIEHLQDVPIEAMQEWNDDHKVGKTIIIDDVTQLADHDDRKKFLSQQNIKSLISVPLMNNDLCIGFVGFNSVENHKHYTNNEITILKIFAHLLVNISNRIDLSKELIQEKERATESDKLKSNLLKNISHEFRTPLNGIIGLSELLQNKPIDAEYQKMASMILTSGIRLNYVLDSIMLLSQLESLTETKLINLEPINLSSFLLSLTKQYQSQINQKGLDLITELQPDITVRINENLFKQALIHIINNAIKYTRTGSVKISCTQTSPTSHIEIIIEDTGIGIPKESQAIIFSDFRQVSEGYNRAYEGCGLGLPIAKRAIELMQGEISLESELEKGTKITITLPFITDNQKNTEALESDKKSTKKTSVEKSNHTNEDKAIILIVEDNIVNQKLATSILGKYYQTDSAFDGESAISMITQKQYDAILMDIHLGEGLDGLEVTKIIRDDLRYKQTPIIAVTGYTMLGDKEQILKQGCSDYLGKPYNKTQLLEIIEKALQ